MWIIFLMVIVFVVIIASNSNTNPPKKNNLPTRKSIDVVLNEFKGHYSFYVSGVHLQDYLYPVLNYCQEMDKIILEPEPNNSYDSDAIKVINSGWHIGYVPMGETFEVHQIIKKEHVAYIEKIEKLGYISVSVKIRYKE